MIAGLQPYLAMKRSGVEWLGDVPDHWDLVPNRALVRQRKVLVGERHPDYTLLSLTKRGVIVRDVDNGGGKFSADMGTSQEVRVGDLIFCFFDVPETPRTVGLSDHDGMITGAYTIFECQGPVIARYFDLFYRAMDDRKLLSPLYSGLRNTIPPARFLGAKSPVPPLSEQAAIVRYLDHVDRRISRYIRAKQRLIELLEEEKQVIIHRAVTRGLDPDVPLKPSGVEWLGDVPEHWTVSKVKNLARSAYKAFVDGDWIESPYITTSGIRLIQTGNIGVGTYREKGFRYISESTFSELRCTEFDPGDVLICRLGEPVGRACEAPDLGIRMITSVDVCILKARPGVLSAYLVYAMSSSRYLDWVGSLVRGSTRDRVSRSMLGGFTLPLPPANEQAAIIRSLDGVTASVATAIEQAGREISLLREYRTRLTSDVVTGKLDVRAAGSCPARG